MIIVSYNGERYLQACLASVLDQLTEADQLIVVDNNSTDSSGDLIRTRYPQVDLIGNKHNLGFAAACNQAAIQARGNILVFLNQDTRVDQGWLAGLVQGLEQDERVGLTTSQVRLMSRPERLHMAGQEVHYTGLVSGRGFMQAADAWAQPAEVSAVSGASFAVRRSLWETLGGFDEILYMYYEETDLCWRARLLGYRSWYIPGSRVYHDYCPERPGHALLFYSFRNRYLLLLKTLRWRTLTVLAPGLLLAELLEWALAVAHGQAGIAAKWQAVHWLLTHPRIIIQQRTCAQHKPRQSDGQLLLTLSYHLHPRVTTGGPVGRLLVSLVNLLLGLIYHTAMLFCRRGRGKST